MNSKKLTQLLWKIIVIFFLIWAIFVMVEIIRIKNNLTSHPAIILSENSSGTNKYYYGIGYSEEYVYNNGKLERVVFRLFNIIKIWDVKVGG